MPVETALAHWKVFLRNNKQGRTEVLDTPVTVILEPITYDSVVMCCLCIRSYSMSLVPQITEIWN